MGTLDPDLSADFRDEIGSGGAVWEVHSDVSGEAAFIGQVNKYPHFYTIIVYTMNLSQEIWISAFFISFYLCSWCLSNTQLLIMYNQPNT